LRSTLEVARACLFAGYFIFVALSSATLFSQLLVLRILKEAVGLLSEVEEKYLFRSFNELEEAGGQTATGKLLHWTLPLLGGTDS